MSLAVFHLVKQDKNTLEFCDHVESTFGFADWRALCASFPLRIACLSAPSVYQKLKQGVVDGSDRVSAVVLEYDRRFASYGEDFVFYDYNKPLSLLDSVSPHSFDIVLADPPYLSEECLSKVTQTIKYLSKGKVLLCTGETQTSSDDGT